MNLELICKQVCNLSRSVGNYLYEEVTKIKLSDIETKGLHNFVTYVDTTAEKRLVSELSKILPQAGFIVEENTITKKDNEYNWIVDPLDGTTNFIHSIPIYSISIALMRNDKVVMGVVYEINSRECFYAWENSDAFLNRAPIHASDSFKLDDSLIATGFPYYDFKLLDPYLELLKYLLQNTRGVRRLGSAAVDLVYVACGRFDAFFEYGLNPWDVAAGSFIVQQAGGEISDFSGKNDYIFGKQIIASGKEVYFEFLDLIRKHFK